MKKKNVEKNDRAFEFFMNRFRLLEAVPKQEFEHYTGLFAKCGQKIKLIFAIQQNYIVENTGFLASHRTREIVLERAVSAFFR